MVEKRVLTDRLLRSLKPASPGKRLTLWDGALSNFCVRVTDRGAISFLVVRRATGDRRLVNHVLGSYPAMSLADARGAAQDALKLLARGERPLDVREAKKREEARRLADTFDVLAEDFCAKLETGRIAKARGKGPLRNAGAMAAVIRRELIPAWRRRPVSDIARRDVITLIERIVERGGAKPAPGTRRKTGGQYAARHTLAAARRLFDWALERDILPTSPCERIKAARVHGAPENRPRVLDDRELRWVWEAAAAASYPFGPLVRLLILTGQRRDEIAEASWGEVGDAVLTIPPERMKGGEAHTVPLPPAAVAIMDELPRFTDGGFLFSTTAGKRPFSGHSKAKARLNAAVAQLAASVSVPPWTLHDLRRTVRTGLSSLDVLPTVAELVLAHKQQGISAVYDLHKYDRQKRAALEAWADKVASIVGAPDPEPARGNVVPLRARA